MNKLRLLLGGVLWSAVVLLDLKMVLSVFFNYDFGVVYATGDAFMVSQAVFISVGAVLIGFAFPEDEEDKP